MAKRAVVIGTGAGGLTATAALARAGFEVVALERAKQLAIADNGGPAASARLLLAVDEDVCARTLADILYTASRLEFEAFGIVVERAPYEYAAVPLGFALADDTASAGPATVCSEDAARVRVRDRDQTSGALLDEVIALRGRGCDFDGGGECCRPTVILESVD